MRVWANAWDVLGRTPSRGGRGRRAAVGLFRGVFFFVFGGISCFFCSFSFLRTHTACCKYELPLASFTSLLVINVAPTITIIW